MDKKDKKIRIFLKFKFLKFEIKKTNNKAVVIGNILSSLWKLYPLNISRIPIKILSIILWCNIDFKINIEIINKNINLIFLCLEKKDKKNNKAVKIIMGI